MLMKPPLRQFLATLFTGVYLFVALFSQNFHNHGSGEVFKDFHFKKSEKTFSESSFYQNFSDCLSCHILHDGNFLVPEVFQVTIANSIDFQQQVFAYQQRFSKLEFLCIQLRGPPANFI